MTERISIVLADDSVIIRAGVRALLDELDEVDVVAECSTYDELMDAVVDHTPALVITDIRMPPTHTDEGIRAALTIRKDHPDTGVIVLSQFSQPEYALLLFEEGSQRLGYLLKHAIGDVERLRQAILAVAEGGSSVDPEIIDLLVTARAAADGPTSRLTPRETEVLAAIAEGLNNTAIAERLVLSPKAVSKHIGSIFAKLDVGGLDDAHHRVKAALIYLAS